MDGTAPDRNLALELVRVTEAAAMGAARWIGRGEKESDDQAEVDRYWDALLRDGGTPSVCGWLKDRFGVSWQVIPRQLNEYLSSSDRDAAQRAMEAMLKMVKIDVEKLREAYEGVPA